MQTQHGENGSLFAAEAVRMSRRAAAVTILSYINGTFQATGHEGRRMSDPFQNVDGAGTDFIDAMAAALEKRAAEPVISDMVYGYLDRIDFPTEGLHVEVGAGNGAITRLIAERARSGHVIGTDLSKGLIEIAKKTHSDVDNLAFQEADGTELPFKDASVDNVVMHTVLSHVPDPGALVAEAVRVLKPCGRLVVCDVDFEKTSLGNARVRSSKTS